MKKSILLIISICTCIGISAQEAGIPGTISTRKSNSADGKTLTMEETILSRELAPKNLYCRWISPDEIMMHKDGRWTVWNISDDSYSEPSKPAASIATFNKGKSLWIRFKDGSEKPIAESENENITYGQSVSRNEFGIMGGIFWSPDSTRIAFYRKDESKVTSFPLLDITSRTGSLKACSLCE